MAFSFFRGFVVLLISIFILALQACNPSFSDKKEDSKDVLKSSEIIPPVAMSLSQIEQTLWKLDLKLPEIKDKDILKSERVMIFSRSRGDYRRKRFKHLSGAATLERVGGFDTLIFAPGETQASFEITPKPITINGTYDPFIDFSDGGLAIYLGAFELLPVATTEAIIELDENIDNWSGEQLPLPIRVKSSDTLILNGEYINDGEVELTIQGGAPYVYMGSSRISRGTSYIGVVDSGLPSWILDSFDDDLAQLFDFYEGAFGAPLPKLATLLFAFGGAESPGLSNTGGVTPGGQIILDVSGELMITPEPRIIGYLKWFFAHEAAHLFQMNSELEGYSDQSDSWISEGGANAMVDVAFTQMDGIDENVRQSQMGQAYDACVQSIEGSNMADLIRRNDQSHYDCGQILWWIADASITQADIFRIWNEMAANVKVSGRKTYNRELFFETLEELGTKKEFITDMQAVLDGPNTNPDKIFRKLIEAADLNAVFDDGSLVSIEYPPNRG